MAARPPKGGAPCNTALQVAGAARPWPWTPASSAISLLISCFYHVRHRFFMLFLMPLASFSMLSEASNSNEVENAMRPCADPCPRSM